jgi:transcriptional regulator with XRE-family HTH domain
MDFGKKLLELRKEKGLNREALAKMIGTSGAIIGKYERNERTPSVEIAKNIAQALDVSLDFMVGNTELILDPAILQKIQEIQQLPDVDRNHLLYLMDNILQNVKAKKAFA